MTITTTEPDNRRLAYLHEAGHAVVAMELDLQVVEVVCDGETGHCHAELRRDAHTALMQAASANCDGKLASVETFRQVVEAYFPRLACGMGGIACENLELGRPIYSTRRASDDFPEFFGFLASMSRHLKAPESTPIWSDTFQRAQDRAWDIVRKRADDVRSIADALERSSRLTETELIQLI
jgi:hypothetical protein